MKVGKRLEGFTIIEVLIVIVIIAILVTITIVSYNSVTERSNNTTVQNDLRKIAGKFESYKSEKGVYPAGTSQLTDIGISLTKSVYSDGFTNVHNLLYCRVTLDAAGAVVPGPYKFAIIAESKSGDVFAYRSETGDVEQLSGWTGGTSNTNCQAVGINQLGGTDRDWFYYNDAWLPYVTG
jgi:prepilin-type N-terminal cleavage/methylation domain-containing protein